MNNELFTPMELDALGEIMNIALGSSATVVSNILGHRVAITTPRISVADPLSFELGDFNPAFGVEISYLEGLSGSNILLLKRRDVKMILDILMGEESGDEELELNELTVSAICELMNQMMGAASTALSEMLSCTVNISTPLPFELNDPDTFRLERLPQNEKIVAVRFSLNIEGVLNSEFINIISVSLAKEFLGESFMAGNIGPQEEPVQSSPKKETERPASFPVVEPVPAAPAPQPRQRMAAPPAAGSKNLELIKDVPVRVSVEIGRVKRRVQDVLELNKGSLIILDKPASEAVDLLINGRPLAKGRVVVVDDNYGVLISELLQKTDGTTAAQN